MKGNRLNTAANLGTFNNTRKSVNIQRQIAASTDAMLNVQMQQAALVNHDRFVAYNEKFVAQLEKDVDEGRLSPEQANAISWKYFYNQRVPRPLPKDIRTPGQSTPSIWKMLGGGNAGTPSGWYTQGPNLNYLRFWNGTQWEATILDLSTGQQHQHFA